MHIYFTVIIFILGLVLASFLNALLYRIDNGYKYPDIFLKRSHCEKCKKELKWYELIPVLSYVIYRAKCQQCEYKIPLYYPISELILGISLSSIFYFNYSPTLYILVIFLFVMSYFDRIYKGVPQIVVHIFLAYSFISFSVSTLFLGHIQENSILFALFFTLSIYILSKILKKKFGIGDLFVLLGMGFLISLQMYISFIYLFLFVSLLYSVVLILFKRATLRSSLALLPFMYISFSLMLILYKELEIILEKLFYL